MATPKPVKTPKHLESKDKAIFKLVSTMGVNKHHCIVSLNLPANYFQRYIGALDNFEKAKAKFTEKLIKATMDNLSLSDANRKFMLQKTRAFDIGIDLPVVKDNKSAQKALGMAIAAFARKELSESELVAIKTSCATYSELSVHVDLQVQVEKLQKLFEEKSK